MKFQDNINLICDRLRELDELYTNIQIVSGFTVEQLFEMFKAGYTLQPPKYSALEKFSDFALKGENNE